MKALALNFRIPNNWSEFKATLEEKMSTIQELTSTVTKMCEKGDSRKNPDKIKERVDRIVDCISGTVNVKIDRQVNKALRELKQITLSTIDKLEGTGAISTDLAELKRRCRRITQCLVGMDKILAASTESIRETWNSQRDSLKKKAIEHFDSTLTEHSAQVRRTYYDGSPDSLISAIDRVSLISKNMDIVLRERRALLKDDDAHEFKQNYKAAESKLADLTGLLHELGHQR